MKIICFIPLAFLTACSTAPKLTVRPQQPPPGADNAALRFSDIVRAYHFGRYVDPNDALVMHEKHVVYRVEEDAHWDLHPNQSNPNDSAFNSRPNAAFAPTPTNEAILAEVNSQKLATIRIMAQARDLATVLSHFETALAQTKTNFQGVAELRTSVAQIKNQLDALESIRKNSESNAATNKTSDTLEP